MDQNSFFGSHASQMRRSIPEVLLLTPDSCRVFQIIKIGPRHDSVNNIPKSRSLQRAHFYVVLDHCTDHFSTRTYDDRTLATNKPIFRARLCNFNACTLRSHMDLGRKNQKRSR